MFLIKFILIEKIFTRPFLYDKKCGVAVLTQLIKVNILKQKILRCKH